MTVFMIKYKRFSCNLLNVLKYNYELQNMRRMGNVNKFYHQLSSSTSNVIIVLWNKFYFNRNLCTRKLDVCIFFFFCLQLSTVFE